MPGSALGSGAGARADKVAGLVSVAGWLRNMLKSLPIIAGLTTGSPSSTLTMASHSWSDSTVLSR
ncbi:hypothetical protein FQZ97_1187480 [compost metagenome]